MTTTLEYDLKQNKVIQAAGWRTRSSEQGEIHQMKLQLRWTYENQQSDKKIPTKHIWVWLRAI